MVPCVGIESLDSEPNALPPGHHAPLIRAVTGQRSSPDLCFATTSVKIYDP